MLGFLLLLLTSSASFAQTVRERLQDPEFRVYSVIFGLTVDAKSRVDAFRVSKVTDPMSGTTKAVAVAVPEAYVEAARLKAKARHYKPSVNNGEPVEFFTYYFYAPTFPSVVITDLDRPIESQP